MYFQKKILYKVYHIEVENLVHFLLLTLLQFQKYLHAFLQTAGRNGADWADAFAASLRGSLQTAYGSPDAARQTVSGMIAHRRELLQNRRLLKSPARNRK